MNPRTTLWPAAALALLSMACSDPAPTPAAVGLHLSTHVPYTPTAENSICPSWGIEDIGNPPPSDNPPVPGGRVTDGDGVSVNCAVKGATSFTFSAAIAEGAVKFNISAGKIDTTTKAGTFKLSMNTPDTGDLMTETAPCTISVEDSPLQVSKGNLFARFDCPSLWNRENATPTACGGDGVIVLEFCEE